MAQIDPTSEALGELREGIRHLLEADRARAEAEKDATKKRHEMANALQALANLPSRVERLEAGLQEHEKAHTRDGLTPELVKTVKLHETLRQRGVGMVILMGLGGGSAGVFLASMWDKVRHW